MPEIHGVVNEVRSGSFKTHSFFSKAIVGDKKRAEEMMTDARDDIRSLYGRWIKAWNDQNASGMAATLVEDGVVIGFDGSQMLGPLEVREVCGKIFEDHPTGRFVTSIREVRTLTPDVALLRAAVGMVPRVGDDINPAVNTFQSIVAVKKGAEWRIALFQNTPAAFHGRPEEVIKLSAELRQALKDEGLR